jgi:hypothetical protein
MVTALSIKRKQIVIFFFLLFIRKKCQKGLYTMSSYCVIGPEIPYPDHVTTYFYGGADGINFKDRTGRTALHTAVAKGRSRVVEKLLHKGADPDIVDNEGYTALHLAIVNCRIDLVRLLLRFEADCNASTKSLSPFALAVKILSETSMEFDPISTTSSSTVINMSTTSSKYAYEDFSCPVVIVNNMNAYKDFTQDYFSKYISRGLLHISYTLLYYGCEIWPEAKSTGRCCQLLEKVITTVTQPQTNASVYSDLLTLSVSIERLCQNGCSLSDNFSTHVSKFRDYQENELRKRIMKLFCHILKGKEIKELAKLVCGRRDEEMIQYMLACGHRKAIEAVQLGSLVSKKILATLRQPSSLSVLCRVAVRENLSINKHGCSVSNIGALLLPKSLKIFLSFNDWNDYQ